MPKTNSPTASCRYNVVNLPPDLPPAVWAIVNYGACTIIPACWYYAKSNDIAGYSALKSKGTWSITYLYFNHPLILFHKILKYFFNSKFILYLYMNKRMNE